MPMFTLLVLSASLLAANSLAYECFRCSEQCVTYSWRCDGQEDCYHGEDEGDCEFICPYETHHRCSDTGLCYTNAHLCDGFYDCPNGEDEGPNCRRGGWVGKRGAKRLDEKEALLAKSTFHGHYAPTNKTARISDTKPSFGLFNLNPRK